MRPKTLQRRQPPTKAASGHVVETLAARLAATILDGEAAIGSALPSERALMERHGVSRATVREALRALGAQGLIEIRRGRKGGSFVTAPPPQLVEQTLRLHLRAPQTGAADLALLRMALEPAAAAAAARNRTALQLAALEGACGRCEAQMRDPAEFVQQVASWYHALAEAAGSPPLTPMLAALAEARADRLRDAAAQPRTRKALMGALWQVQAAVTDRDPEAAHRRMGRLLGLMEPEKAVNASGSG
ncbi:MAG: FadR family transcriptional regulator [Alphaproteobacteria bacterium]|nr:MAG: FadR family transcriptional regulator [Alphaproteobacteria bacterium]